MQCKYFSFSSYSAHVGLVAQDIQTNKNKAQQDPTHRENIPLTADIEMI